jgi:hypothetical protein
MIFVDFTKGPLKLYLKLYGPIPNKKIAQCVKTILNYRTCVLIKLRNNPYLFAAVIAIIYGVLN